MGWVVAAVVAGCLLGALIATLQIETGQFCLAGIGGC